VQQKQSSLGYAITFAIGLAVLTIGAVVAFWAVTGSEVERSAAEAAEARRPRPEPPVDTTPPWQPAPEVALRDSLFIFRESGQLDEALRVLEAWLAEYPDDRPIRLDGARIAFEVGRRQRGVFHYRWYLAPRDDRPVLQEAVNRILAELSPAEARAALASMLYVDLRDFPVRIGLARATADAGYPAAADSLLNPIPPHIDPVVDELRLLVRRSINPDIPTATRWVAEYPGEVLYRLVLARALAREGRPGDALEHYVAAFDVDTTLALREEAANAAVAAGNLEMASGLLERILEREAARESALLSYGRVRARLGDNAGAVQAFERLMALDPDDARFAEARGVLFEVNDTELTLPLLARLVAYRPADDALRLRYAQDLERTQRLALAEAQYDTLIVRAPSAPLLLTRARLRSAQNNLSGALADAAASEAREPSLDAALLQAEIHRWRSERELSRQGYERAARFAPDDPRVVEGRRLLAVQRRDALYYEPAYGTVASSNGLGDSDGFGSFTLRAQQGSAPFTSEMVLIAGGELHQVSGGPLGPQRGIGGDIGLARAFGRANLLGRVGLVTFEGGTPVPTATFEMAQRSQTRSLRGAVVHAPAYESLRSAHVIAPNDVLSATTLLGSFSSQLSPRLEIFVQADHTRLGDGNARSVGVGAVKYAVRGPVAVLYTASAATFGEGTADYWSPELFVTQGVGLDVRQNRPRGWSAGARISPAFAWVRETAPSRPVGMQSALQATLAADATWRSDVLELGLFAGYGQDRAGTYAAGFGGLRARLTR
jgi:tetratricopeptide (TPR) repeat protein